MEAPSTYGSTYGPVYTSK